MADSHSIKSRVRLGALLALALLIVSSIYYLGSPAPSETTAASAAPKDQNGAATLGKIETVMTPPRTFKGRNGQDEFSTEKFSSNPKRDPSEALVLKIAKERGVADDAKVKRLLDLIPTLPPEAQVLAMENATSLIRDSNYLEYRGRLLQLAKTPEMREAVMDDSLTRGEEIRLPNLLEMMRTSTSDDEKLEIREIFEAYLDKDYGPNPVHWEAPLREWVAANVES